MDRNANQKNKEIVWDFWQRMNYIDFKKMPALVKTKMHKDVAWYGPQPINEQFGVEAVIENYWLPLYQSFPDLKRKCDVFMGGESKGEYWVSASGYFSGTFTQDWLGIPASREKTNIHFGQFYKMEGGLIVENFLILDILSVARQAGFQLLPPSRGAEGGKFLPPTTGDGVMLAEQDALESKKTRQIVSAMIEGMMRFNGQNLDSMEMQNYWHTNMHWYGPTGIGSCYSLEEFQDFHQRPWLKAFPDRGLKDSIGKGHWIGLSEGEILAEGHFASLGIWDTVFSSHKGKIFGIPASGKLMTIRDFDWYRRDGAKLIQNWVPIDLIDLCLQMGVDPFERLQEQIQQKKEYARKG